MKKITLLGALLVPTFTLPANPEWRHIHDGTIIRSQETGGWFKIPGCYYPKFSPDGRFVHLHGGVDEILVDTWAKRFIAKIPGCVLATNPRAPIMLVAFHNEANAILIDMATGRRIGQPMYCVRKISPDGRFIAADGWHRSHQTHIHSALNGRLLKTYTGTFCDFAHDDADVVILSSDGLNPDIQQRIADE